jgi:carbon-monoxide dehydrogenase large subunit
MSGLLDTAFVRSGVAHGRVRSVDAGPARGVRGVAGAWGAADLPDLPAMTAVGPTETTDGRDCPALATDRVRYVGQTVAVIVADDRYAAEDGADAVGVDIEPLPAVVDPTEAAEGRSVALFEGLSNVVNVREAGERIGDGV